MHIENVEYIIAIAEEKSLSKAADRLLISQPALSQYLKKLEQELDTKLFYRSKNELFLTDAGRIYVNGARLVSNIYYQALEEIKTLKQNERKQISIMYSKAYIPAISTLILPEFQKKHPDIYVQALDGNAGIAKDYLINGLIQLGIFSTGELSHSILEYIPLYQDELLLAISKKHPCAQIFSETGVDFEQIKQEAVILSHPESYSRQLEEKILAENRFSPSRVYETSDFSASRHMMCDGKGIAFLPRSLVHGNPDYCCFSLKEPAYFHTVIAYHKSMPFAGELRNLILLILNAYEKRL